MHLPQFHMSNGPWIFATGVAVALIASPSIYAAATSVVSLGNPTGNATAAVVAGTHQLQTVTTGPTNLVAAAGSALPGNCTAVYIPPPGKAIVVTQITYDFGTGTQGTESSGGMEDASCNGHVYDFVDTIQAYETQAHTFPTGLPLAGVGIYNSSFGSAPIAVSLTGYLIPATQLPPNTPQSRTLIKGMLGRG